MYPENLSGWPPRTRSVQYTYRTVADLPTPPHAATAGKSAQPTGTSTTGGSRLPGRRRAPAPALTPSPAAAEVQPVQPSASIISVAGVNIVLMTQRRRGGGDFPASAAGGTAEGSAAAAAGPGLPQASNPFTWQPLPARRVKRTRGAAVDAGSRASRGGNNSKAPSALPVSPPTESEHQWETEHTIMLQWGVEVSLAINLPGMSPVQGTHAPSQPTLSRQPLALSIFGAYGIRRRVKPAPASGSHGQGPPPPPPAASTGTCFEGPTLPVSSRGQPVGSQVPAGGAPDRPPAGADLPGVPATTSPWRRVWRAAGMVTLARGHGGSAGTGPEAGCAAGAAAPPAAVTQGLRVRVHVTLKSFVPELTPEVAAVAARMVGRFSTYTKYEKVGCLKYAALVAQGTFCTLA